MLLAHSEGCLGVSCWSGPRGHVCCVCVVCVVWRRVCIVCVLCVCFVCFVCVLCVFCVLCVRVFARVFLVSLEGDFSGRRDFSSRDSLSFFLWRRVKRTTVRRLSGQKPSG